MFVVRSKSEESVCVVALRPEQGESSRHVGLLWLPWHGAAAPSGDSSFVGRLWPQRAMVADRRQTGEVRRGEYGLSWPTVSCLALSMGLRGRVVVRRKNVSLPLSAFMPSASSCGSGLRCRSVTQHRRLTGPDSIVLNRIVIVFVSCISFASTKETGRASSC